MRRSPAWSLGTNGHYSFDPSNAAYQHIAQGATQIVVATYVVTDQHGATDTATLTITITGTNDAPDAVVDARAVNEDGAPITGNVGGNDTDADDGATRTFAAVGPVPAGLSFSPDGSYSFDPSNAAYQHIANGDSEAVTLTYTITDQHGASDTATLTITVAGVNDAAIFSGDVSGSASETNAPVTITGDLDVSDVDGADTVVAQSNVHGSYGTFNIDSGGAWSYVADSAYDSLAPGASLVESFTVLAADGTSQSVTVTINGTNDAPVAVNDVYNAAGGGADLQVNTYTPNQQMLPAVAALQGGGYVVTWQSLLQDGSGWGIYAQRYNSAGQTAGGEVVINTTTLNEQDSPTIATLGNGDYIIAWRGMSDGSGWGIYAQRFNADGTVDGTQFGVNSITFQDQWAPSVAALSDGGFVMTWMSSDTQGFGITARIFGANGIPAGNDFQVNSYIPGPQFEPMVAGLTGGGFVVSWMSSGQDGSGQGIFTRQYNAAGVAITGDIQVNTYVPNDQSYPSITALDGGGYVVAWQSLGQDGSGWGAYARVYNAAGVPQTGEFLLSTMTAGDQLSPSVSALDGGGFVVTWTSADASGLGIYSRTFDATGVPTSAEAAVNTVVAGDQVSSWVAGLDGGGFVAGWQSADASGWGIHARRFGSTVFEDGAVVTGSVATNDSDTDTGDTLTYALDTPVSGLILNSDGSYSFNPADAAYQHLAAGASEAVVATYIVTDTHGASASATLTITVTGVNDAPVAADDSFAATEDTPVTYAAADLLGNDTDVDLDTLVIASVSNFTGGVAVLNGDGTVTFTPALNYNGVAGFDYVVSDGHGGTDTGHATINVAAVNDAPVLTGLSPAIAFAENTVNATPQLLDSDVSFTDAEGNFDGGSLTVSGLLAEDRIAVRNEGVGAGQIGVSGANITYGGTVIGTLAGGAGSTLIVTLNAAATSAAVDALIQNLTYANVSDTPTADRTLTINVTDAAGADFAPESFAPLASNPFAGFDVGFYATPTFVDLDNDGDLDAVVGQNDGLLVSFRNNGDGTFTSFGAANPFAGMDFGTNASPTFVDLDNDGDLDAVIGTTSGELLSLANNGGVFSELVGSANPFNGIDVGNDANPVFADIDGDGDLDLVVGNDDGQVLTYRNDGGSYTALAGAANPFDGVDVGGRATPDFADLDNDGDLDAVIGALDGQLRYFENNAGVFTERTGAANPFDGVDVGVTSSPSFFDVDNDGDLDVVVGEYEGGMVVLENTAQSQTILVSVTAENDVPVANDDTDAAVEDGPTVTGSVATNDSDADASVLTYALTGTVAGLTLDSDGAYSFNPSNAAYQSLAAGASTAVVASYTVTDEHGASDTATLTIVVTGTNDAPVVGAVTLTPPAVVNNNADFGSSPDYTGWAVDLTQTGYSGSTSATIDRSGTLISGDLAVAVLSLSGTSAPYGTGYGPRITSSSFTANAGESVTITYNILYGGDEAVGRAYIRDAATNAIVQTIFDYSLNPVAGSTGVQTVFASIATAGTYYLDIQAGSYDETGGQAIGAQMYIGFAGRANIITEDGAFTFTDGEARLLANATDVDTGDVLDVSPFVVTSAKGATITLAADGSLIVDPRGSTQLQQLAEGTSTTDTFTFTVHDANGGSTTSTATYTVFGVNDAPTGVNDSRAVVEAGVNPGNTSFSGTASVTGNILTNDTDPDTGDTLRVSTVNGQSQGLVSFGTDTIPGTYGSLAIQSNGTYTYSLNNSDPDTNALAQGQTATETFNYVLLDGLGASSTATLTITITGTNDRPVAVADVNGADVVTESGVNPGNTAFAGDASATGNVLTNDTDVDTGDTKTVSGVTGGSVGSAVTGTYGSIVIDADGDWTYSLDNTDPQTQALAQGQVVTETFTYTVQDTNGATSSTTLTITITGTNDAPDAVNDAIAAIEDGPIVTGSVATNDTDVDAGATRTFMLNAPVAGLTLNSAGGYIFNTLDPAYQYLAEGVTQNVVATYTVTDQHGATDIATLTITITGTNDAPVANDDTAEAIEDGAIVTGDVSLDDTDVDVGDTHTYALVGSTPGLTMTSAGVYTFDPASYDSIAAGATQTVTATYVMTDNHGGSDTAQLVITVTGVNDAPVATADTAAVSETGVNPGNTPFGNGTATGNVLANDADVDIGDTRTVSAVQGSGGNVGSPVAGSYGSVTIGATGGYTYTLNNGLPAVNALAQGATVTDSFTYTVVDNHGASSSTTLTVTITGTNDAPVAVADTASATEDGTAVTGTVATGDSDVDTGAVLTYALNGTVAGLTVGSDGSYSFDPSDTAYQHIAQGHTETVTASYTVTDEFGATDISTLTITVTGTNDAPTAVADVDSAVEAGVDPGNTAFAGDPSASGNVLSNDTDVDDDASLAVSSVNGDAGNVGVAVIGTYGSITIAADGSYTYTLDNGDADTEALAAGASATDTFSYTVTDEFGAISTTTLTINITGTNDAPVASADTNVGDAVIEAGVNPGNTPVGDATASGNVLTNDTDVDTGDTKTVSAVEGDGGNVGTAVTGIYGSVVINDDGTYTYTLDDSDADTNALIQGATVTDSFTYTMVDANGATSTSTLIMTIIGSNDAPIVVADTNLSDAVVEAGVNPGNTPAAGDPSASGNVLDNDSDVDTGDSLTVSAVEGDDGNVGNAVTGTYGSVVIAANGSYTYTLDNDGADTNALAHGATVTDTFTYTVLDEYGATSTTTLTITITGTNDAPVASADTNATDAVIEAGVNPGNTPVGDGTASGNVLDNDTDVDSGDSKTVSAVTGGSVGTAVTGTYGSVTINADGSYVYTLNDGDADTNALAQGATVTDQFTYTMVDANGATSTSTLTITIDGTNDAPVAGDDVASAIEDGAVVFSSVAGNDTDVDTGASRTFALVGTVPGLTLNGDGSYVFNPLHPAYQHIAQGATQTVVATYEVTDEFGATDTATLTITVTGTNDAPVAADDVNSATEDGAVVTGNVGSNDSDVDDDASSTYALVGTVDGLTINPDGSYSFNPSNAAYQHLAAGVTQTVVATYTATDSHGATDTGTLTITVTGTNDAAVIGGDTSVNLSEADSAAAISASGQLTISDADTGQNSFVANLGTAGTYGTFAVDSAGAWSFTASSAHNELAAGVTYTDAFTVTTFDGTTQVVTVTITGSNDGPVANADTNAGDAVVEAGVNPGNVPVGDATATGNVLANDTDIDMGDTKTVSAVAGGTVGAPVTGTYGSVTINADGSYTYTLDNSDADTQALAQGATVTDQFSYVMVDASGASATSTLTITITGSNDAPTVVADTNAGDAVVEAGVNPGNTPFAGDSSASGNLLTNDSDVDFGSSLAVSAVDGAGGNVGNAVTGTYGSVTIAADGSYTYLLANGDTDTNALAQGATATDVFTYTVIDTNGATSTATLTITISGTNDAPVAGADTAAATEDGAVLTGNVGANDIDVDAGDTHIYTINGAAPAGFSLSSNGSYTFNPLDPAYQHLAAGATQTVLASYTTTDNHGASSTATLTITVTGTNDAPDAVNDTSTAVEDGALVTGNVGANDTDIDGGATRTFAAAGPVPAGLSFNPDGSYSFDPSNSAYQHLAAGATETVSLAYTISDGLGGTDTATLTITVVGTNDAPVAADDTASAIEDGSIVTGTVGAGDTDVDDGATRTYALNGSVAGLTIAPNGDYSFDPSSYDSLGAGATQVVTANYIVTDDKGATDTGTLTITVTGINDAPDAENDTNSAVEDGALVTGTVAANDTDADIGDTRTYALNAPVAGLTLNPDGSYSFNPADAAYQHIALGATQTVVATYTFADGQGATDTATLTITVTGTNDAPDAVNDTIVATEDGAPVSGNLGVNDTDVDDGATRTYLLLAPVAGLTLSPAGNYVFDPSSYDSVPEGGSLTVSASYRVVDNNGATDTATITITINGVNDAPDAVNDSNAATEDGAIVSGNVGFNDLDVDSGDSRTYALNGTVDGLTINPDGSYSFDPSAAAYQHIALGATQIVTATYTMTDGAGATDTATLTITVTGTNDAPVAVAETRSVAEDGGTITGNVGANDTDVDDGATRSFAAVGPVPAGLTFGADGGYSFDPSSAAYQHLAQGATQQVVLTYTITDDQGATDTATLTITVTGTNDAPLAQDNAIGAIEDGAVVTGNVAAGDTDPDDGATRTYALVGAAPAGLTFNPDGSYSFDPASCALDRGGRDPGRHRHLHGNGPVRGERQRDSDDHRQRHQ